MNRSRRSTLNRSFTQSDDTPTVVLVHGANADSSGWAAVIGELQADDVLVLALANPLRGLPGDAAYIAARVKQIDRPVLLVGHSYGGAVITVAGAEADNVVGLVYVAAFLPDKGESANEIYARFPSKFAEGIRPYAFPVNGTGATAVEVSLAPEEYLSVFGAGMPAAAAAVAAVSQRPIATSALEDKASAAAWKTLPSWAVVATADHAINPEAQRFMARRAGAQTIEVNASHAVMVVEPKAVTEHIRAALRSVTTPVAT
jgi:pimeloyl-ACP methyl ester carboxylesterase